MTPEEYHASSAFATAVTIYSASGYRDMMGMKRDSKRPVRPLQLSLSPVVIAQQCKSFVRMDMGALRLHPLADRLTANRLDECDVARELVFDFDLDLAKCSECSRIHHLCNECWTHRLYPVLDALVNQNLIRDMGLSHVGVFFSGRRGAHVVAGDEEVLRLSNRERLFITKWIEESMRANVSEYDPSTFDSGVTAERCHMIRCPLSVHQSSNLVASFINLRDKESSRAPPRLEPSAAIPVTKHIAETVLPNVFSVTRGYFDPSSIGR